MPMRPLDRRLAVRGTDDDPRLGRRLVDDPDRARVCLVGCADDAGVANSGGRAGASLGPTEIRRWLYRLTTGMNGELEALPLFDAGDVLPGADIDETHAEVERVVAEHARQGRIVVFLGGGHDLAYASHAGVFEAHSGRGAVVNVDTHLDVRPLRDGRVITSGTPFRRLLDRFGRRVGAFVELGIQPQHNSRQHAELVRARGGRVVSLDRLREAPSVASLLESELTEAASEQTATAGSPEGEPAFLTVSVDLDVASASDAPGTSAPPADGIAPADLGRFCEAVGRHPKARLLDVMELSPPQDENGKTARLAAFCVWRFLVGVASRRA